MNKCGLSRLETPVGSMLVKRTSEHQVKHAWDAPGPIVRPALEGAVTGVSVLAAALIAIMGLWTASMEAYKREMKQSLMRLAEGAAALVDPELHARIRSPEQIDTPLYELAVAPLRAMQSRTRGVQYIYTFVEDNGGIRFVLDAAGAGDHDDDGVEDRALVWEHYENPDPATHIVLHPVAGRTMCAASDEPYTDKWGTFISGFAPILNAAGQPVGGVGVDMNAQEYLEQVATMRRVALYGLLPAFGASACVGLMVWDQRRRVVSAHSALRRQTMELAEKSDALERQAHELEAERKRAEAANRAKGAFVANMTHELRTPLTAILGYTELLEGDRHLDTEAARWVRTVKRSGEHLLTLINDVLDYSKVEAGKMRVELLDTDPAAILEDVRLLMAEPASTKGLRLDVEWTTPAPPMIRTDPTRLRQILFNLVGNAIKFTAAGTVSVRAAVEAGGTSGHRLIVRVSDTGIGMNEEVIRRLFKPFTQADATMSRRFGGTGLGLSICKELARLMGGDVSAESRPGAGSTFTLQVDAGPLVAPPAGVEAPVSNAGDATQPAATRTNDALSEARSLAGLRVLLVEDGPDNQRLATHHLTRAGAEVTVAENGQLALDATESHDFDLILMDMQMPVLDGYQATRALRRRGNTLPIIALTANARVEDSNLCLAAGCDDFVAKPFTRRSLIELCCRWKGRRSDDAPGKSAGQAA